MYVSWPINYAILFLKHQHWPQALLLIVQTKNKNTLQCKSTQEHYRDFNGIPLNGHAFAANFLLKKINNIIHKIYGCYHIKQ